MIPRFLLQPGQLRRGRAHLDPSQSRRARLALRLSVGAPILLVGPDGTEYRGRIESASPAGVIAALGPRLPSAERALPPVALAQALIKGERMDWLVQKVAELGIARLIPLASARAVVRLGGERASRRQERWQKMASQAAEQSRAPRPMAVDPVASLAEAIARVAGADLLLVPHEEEKSQTLRAAVAHAPSAGSAALFVGPEGGFSPEEIEELTGAGALAVSLGPRILRAETAGIVASALVLQELAARRSGQGE